MHVYMVYKNLLLFFEIFKLFTQITSTTFKKGIIMKIQRNNFNYFWLLRERLTFWKQKKSQLAIIYGKFPLDFLSAYIQ